MTLDELHRQKLEYACFTVVRFLYEQLQQRHINAMEFLSLTTQLPVKLREMQHYTVRD